MDPGLPGREKHPKYRQTAADTDRPILPSCHWKQPKLTFALAPFVSHLIPNSISPSLKASQAQGRAGGQFPEEYGRVGVMSCLQHSLSSSEAGGTSKESSTQISFCTSFSSP